MALGRDYDKQLPALNWNTRNGGILFPYFPLQQGHQADMLQYVNLDGTASVILARIKFPFPVAFITCEAFAVSDDGGLKAAASTVESVIHFTYGTAGLASMDAGTSIALISCDGAGAIGTVWDGTTTKTRIETTQEILMALKTAAVGATSGNEDGGAVVRMWFAQINAPA